jgi:MFS family permease
MGLAMMGNGLQGSLLGLRASSEGFATMTTGLVMSGYYAGFIAGSQVTPVLVARVGHVRVFAALASMVSVSALIHIMYITPLAWVLMRFATGFGFAGIYIVAESWLNDGISNEARGQLLSIYMVVTLGGMGSGPLLLNLADPGGFVLFLLVSALFSLALIPILLTVGPIPAFEAPLKIRLRELYQEAPLGLAGCFVTGLSNGAIIGLGAVYAQSVGLNVSEVALFMSFALWGGVLFQWPLGRLSDTYDRRVILTATTFVAVVAVLLAWLIGHTSKTALLIFFGLLGGMAFPMYSLSLAYTNDRLVPEQMVAASSGLVLLSGAGAMLGPLVTGATMTILGPPGFFMALALIHLSLGLFALHRMRHVPAVPADEQGPPVYVGRISPVAAAAAFETEETEE